MQALELRVGGASFQQISDSLGFYDRSHARKAVFDALRNTPQEPINRLRQLTRERINRLLLACFPKAQAGDPQMIMACTRLLKRQAEFEGLDVPRRVRIKGSIDPQAKGQVIKVYGGFTPEELLQSNGAVPHDEIKEPERRTPPPNRQFGH